MSGEPIRIATRASRLALWQAHHVADLLRHAAPEREIEIVHISTIGDRDKSEPLEQLGGTGVFTREVQKAMLDGRADVAVHSLKDLPTESVEGLILAAVPERASMFDALVLPKSWSASESSQDQSPLDLLPQGARVGTGSLRRQAQLLHHRSDLQLSDVRGNVETRLKKLDDGEHDALILAEAGLRRLELDDRISRLLPPPLIYPAVGQGALGIECRADDADVATILANLSDATTFASVTAERRLLARLEAGCHAPLGVSSTFLDGQLTLEAVVLSRDGSQRLVASAAGAADDADALGHDLAEQLLALGAAALVDPE